MLVRPCGRSENRRLKRDANRAEEERGRKDHELQKLLTRLEQFGTDADTLHGQLVSGSNELEMQAAAMFPATGSLHAGHATLKQHGYAAALCRRRFRNVAGKRRQRTAS